MLKNLNLKEGQEDLRIVEHLDMQKLPESVQQMISLASTPEEQDIILMATLAAASACVPNIYFRYGPTGKKYYANLQCFILAAAASGKGIAMILSAMRGIESRILSGKTDEALYCSDEDYDTAEMIGNKMLLHIATAYRMIDGDAQEVVPEIKPIDQRKVLLEQLKSTFERKELIHEAKTQGVSERTAERWNDKWQEEGIVIKLEHGRYRKVG